MLELAGIGPGPFCAMLLADLGAEVLAVDRSAPEQPGWPLLLGRGRRRVAVDLKHPDGPGMVLDLVAEADALVEGFRPGVAERLGVGPDPCLATVRLFCIDAVRNHENTVDVWVGDRSLHKDILIVAFL